MLTDAEIESAKQRTAYSSGSPHHEHNDCIRIAYEWLDAQAKTQSVTKKAFALKHLIEQWAGRCVSSSDVEVAAEMHPDIKGIYPYYNISARLTEPSITRLADISEAFSQGQRSSHKPADYKIQEL